MIFRKKLTVAFVLIFIAISVLANTSRDIGNQPVLNYNLLSKWIVFYTNINRISNGKTTLKYDPLLEKAAFWQAEYCAKLGDLNHSSNVPGMYSVSDRIKHFGSTYSACGENLTVQFASNTENVSFYIKQDGKGQYYDYGNYTVYWRDERQTAYAMLNSWMHSSGHRANILNGSFLQMGAGAGKGKYSGVGSYYGCQVFSKPSYPGEAKQTNIFNIDIKKTLAEGREIYIINYSGAMELKVINLLNDETPVYLPLTKEKDLWKFEKDKSVKENLFAALYDKEADVLYPVALMK